MSTRVTLSLSLILVVTHCNLAFAQDVRQQLMQRLQERQQQQLQQQQPSWFMRDNAQVNAQKKRQQWNEDQAHSECPVILKNPTLRGANDPWKTLKNAAGQTARTSEHMANYRGNQGYGTNYGTYQDGGQRVTGQYDGMGAMGQDSGAAPVSRQLPPGMSY